jgi:hypothetical protein
MPLRLISPEYILWLWRIELICAAAIALAIGCVICCIVHECATPQARARSDQRPANLIGSHGRRSRNNPGDCREKTLSTIQR